MEPYTGLLTRLPPDDPRVARWPRAPAHCTYPTIRGYVVENYAKDSTAEPPAIFDLWRPRIVRPEWIPEAILGRVDSAHYWGVLQVASNVETCGAYERPCIAWGKTCLGMPCELLDFEGTDMFDPPFCRATSGRTRLEEHFPHLIVPVSEQGSEPTASSSQSAPEADPSNEGKLNNGLFVIAADGSETPAPQSFLSAHRTALRNRLHMIDRQLGHLAIDGESGADDAAQGGDTSVGDEGGVSDFNDFDMPDEEADDDLQSTDQADDCV